MSVLLRTPASLILTRFVDLPDAPNSRLSLKFKSSDPLDYVMFCKADDTAEAAATEALGLFAVNEVIATIRLYVGAGRDTPLDSKRRSGQGRGKGTLSLRLGEIEFTFARDVLPNEGDLVSIPGPQGIVPRLFAVGYYQHTKLLVLAPPLKGTTFLYSWC
jgi:hypothetical protein